MKKKLVKYLCTAEGEEEEEAEEEEEEEEIGNMGHVSCYQLQLRQL